jgi:hypothetical protein
MLKRATRILLTSTAFAAFGLIGVYIGHNQASDLQLIYQPAECEPPGSTAL